MTANSMSLESFLLNCMSLVGVAGQCHWDAVERRVGGFSSRSFRLGEG